MDPSEQVASGSGRVTEKGWPPRCQLLRYTRVRVWLCAIMPGLLAALIGWVVGERADRSFHWEGRVQAEKGDERNQRERSPAGLLLESRNHRGDEEHSTGHGHSRRRAWSDAGRGRRSIAEIASRSGGWRIDWLSAGRSGRHCRALAASPLCSTGLPVRPPNPAFPSLVHTAMYASIGGVGGLAFGGGLGGPGGAAKGLVAGAMGAILGAITYNVVHTIAFPLEWDLSPMPGKGVSRLLAHLCVAFSSIACVVLATDERVQTRRRGKALPGEES